MGGSNIHGTVDEIVRRKGFEGDDPPEFEVIVTHTTTYYIRTDSAKKATQAALEPEVESDQEHLEIRVTELTGEEDIDEAEEPSEK